MIWSNKNPKREDKHLEIFGKVKAWLTTTVHVKTCLLWKNEKTCLANTLNTLLEGVFAKYVFKKV